MIKKFAVIEGGVVVNVAEANPGWSPQGMTVVELGEGEAIDIGYTYDGVVFADPNPAPEPPVAQALTTPLQFVERFTEEEQLAIATATLSDPQIKLWYDKLLASQEVVADDPRLGAGMNAMVSAGLITAQRKDEILGA